MNPYKYSVALRIRGDFNVLELSRFFGFEPTYSRTKGNKRGTVSATGKIVYEKESYFCKNFSRMVDGDVTDSINEIFNLLKGKGVEYSEIAKKYHVELFIGLYGDENFGFVLDQQLIKEANGLGVALSFDIYPYNEEARAAAYSTAAKTTTS